MVACTKKINNNGIVKAISLIEQGYYNDWIIDDLPGAMVYYSSSIDEMLLEFDSKMNNEKLKVYVAGFPVGYKKGDLYYLNNFMELVIRYHEERNGKYGIVGFEIYPKSISTHCENDLNSFDGGLILDYHQDSINVTYSFSVHWQEEKDISIADRWNAYLNKAESNQMHYISLSYSSLFVIVLSSIVGMFMHGFIRRDINKFQNVTNFFEQRRQFQKFKGMASYVLNGTPKYHLGLSLLVGWGTQLLFTFILVVWLFAFKVLHSNIPGKSLSYSVLLFISFSGLSGFISYYFFYTFSLGTKSVNFLNEKEEVLENERPRWLRVSFSSGVMLSGFLLCVILFLNFFVWAMESSNALPFGTIVVLISVYHFCEIPLSLIGGYCAYLYLERQKRMNEILPAPVLSPLVASSKLYSADDGETILEENKKQLKMRSDEDTKKACIMGNITAKFCMISSMIYRMLVCGFIPFLCMYIELSYIYKVIWLHKNSFYYLYGFLLTTVILLIIVVMETVIISMYLQLNAGDYSWHWRSFLVGGSMSVYVLVYSLFYYLKYLRYDYDFVSGLLYFTYSFFIFLLIGLLLGSVGFFTGFFFVNTLYCSVKLD